MMTPAAQMPDWLEPMAATLTQDRFSGGEWVFERKFDGIRLLAYKRGTDVQLYSRNRLPQHLPPLAAAIAGCRSTRSFSTAKSRGTVTAVYHVFDILWLNGHDVTKLPIEDRRALLKELPFTAPMRRVELLDEAEPWERARREGWEGVIAKRRGSPYEHRRSKHWLKMKCESSQELVVGGFTDPQGARVGLGALLVGYYEGVGLRVRGTSRHRLRYQAAARSAPAARRDRDSNATVHKSRWPAATTGALGASGDRRAGCDSSNGPQTTNSGTRVCSASASTRRAREVTGSDRNHPSGEGAVPGRRDHQG